MSEEVRWALKNWMVLQTVKFVIGGIICLGLSQWSNHSLENLSRHLEIYIPEIGPWLSLKLELPQCSREFDPFSRFQPQTLAMDKMRHGEPSITHCGGDFAMLIIRIAYVFSKTMSATFWKVFCLTEWNGISPYSMTLNGFLQDGKLVKLDNCIQAIINKGRDVFS